MLVLLTAVLGNINPLDCAWRELGPQREEGPSSQEVFFVTLPILHDLHVTLPILCKSEVQLRAPHPTQLKVGRAAGWPRSSSSFSSYFSPPCQPSRGPNHLQNRTLVGF